MYFVMIIGLIVLLYICYVVFNRELLYPPVGSVAVFLLCALIGLSRYDDWNISEYSGFAVLLILTGLLCFTFSSFLVYKMFPMNTERSVLPVQRERIEINEALLFLIVITLTAFDYMYYNYIVETSESVRFFGASIGVIINFVRHMGGNDLEKLPLPLYLKLLQILIGVFSTFSIFIFAHNAIFQKVKLKDFLLICIVLLDFIYHLLDGDRGHLLLYIAQFVCLYYFFCNMKTGWKININKKIIKISIRIVLVFFPLFFILAFVVGRYGEVDNVNILERVNVFDYLSIYTSSGIRNFDLFVKQPLVDRTTIFGKETFFSFNRFLYNNFGIGSYYLVPLEFRSINGHNIGNIYTAFRRYYADFDIIGLILITTFLGTFFSWMYNKAKYYAKKGEITFYLLLYSYLVNAVFYFPIEDWFFVVNFSVNRFILYTSLYVLFYCLVKKDLKIKLRFR